MTPRRPLLLAAAVLLLGACGRKAPPVAPELVRPEPPENLAAISSPEGVKLSWLRPMRYSGGKRMNDLARFEIERAPGDGSPPTFTRVATVEVTDQTRFRKERHIEWIDHDVTPGSRHLYRVHAVTLDGYRSAWAGPIAVRFGPGATESPASPKQEPAR